MQAGAAAGCSKLRCMVRKRRAMAARLMRLEMFERVSSVLDDPGTAGMGRAVKKAAGKRGSATVLGDFGINPTTFARDARGELYVGDYPTGRLYRIVATEPPE